jgi:hypothetical protein
VTPEARPASAAPAPESGKRDLPEELVARELEKAARRTHSRAARHIAD